MPDPTDELLDRQRLELLVEEIGDSDLVRQAVQAFLDEVPSRLATIRAALVGTDADELTSAAHALGSPAAMLGAVGVAAQARAVQTAATEGRTDDARALIDQLIATTALTETSMRDYLAEPTSP
jgi:HPt (histidine-containing phosphotransfer) domain-containing protein